VSFSRDGQQFRERPERIRSFWATEAGKKVRARHPEQWGGFEHPSGLTLFSPDNRRVLLAGTTGGVVWIHDTGTGEQTAVLQTRNPNGTFWGLQFSSDGSRVLALSYGKVYLFEAATGRGFLGEDAHNAMFSPDGRRVLTVGKKAIGSIWDAADGKRLLTLKPLPSQPETDAAALAFSPDSQRVLLSYPDHSVRLWDAVAGRELAVLRGHSHKLNDLVFSPDGRRILTVADDPTPRIWDTETGKELLVLKGHERDTPEGQVGVNTGAFSPDGQRVVTCGKEGTARLWDAATGQELASWNGLEGSEYSAAFSADGLWVLTQKGDGMCRLWPVDLLAIAQARIPRDLTPDERRRFELDPTPEDG
jgi:WD40 repeat protein